MNAKKEEKKKAETEMMAAEGAEKIFTGTV